MLVCSWESIYVQSRTYNYSLLTRQSLQKEETDQRLRHLVYAAMRVYGDCNVRMTRDNNQIPTAFVQYWSVKSDQ